MEQDSIATAYTGLSIEKQPLRCQMPVYATNVFSLLELSLSPVNGDGAYLYRFASDGATAHLVLEAGLPASSAAGAVEIAGRAASPAVVSERAWADPRFERFPEFREHRFEGVVSIPLVYGGAVFGFVNICRSRAVGVAPSELAYLVSLGAAIAGLLAHEE